MPQRKKIRYIAANFRLYAPGEILGSSQSLGDWVSTTNQVGRLGTKRGEVIRELNHSHGYLTWRFAWRISQTQYAPFRVAIGLYEKSYLDHLRSYPDKAQYLVDNAQDVYDNDESNTISGLNYFIQCDKLTHLQDIAIRRAMQILQLNFCGTQLIRVRKTRNANQVGRSLSPLFVPFSCPELVQDFVPTENKPLPTVEDFWQNNRIVQFSQNLSELSPQQRQLYVEDPTSFDSIH